MAAATGAIVLAAVLQAAGLDDTQVLGEIQYLPYPVFLLPALAAVAASLVLGTAWRLAALLSLSLLLTVVMGLELPAGEPGTRRTRVMTFNIKGYHTFDEPGGVARIAREIARHDPDILVLQDAGNVAWFDSRHPGTAKALFGDRQVHAQGEYVIASRFALRDCTATPVPVRKGNYAHLHCVVDAHGVEIDLVTAHFTSPREALNAVREASPQALAQWRENLAERSLQADAVAEAVRGRRRPVIVAGDLNAPGNSPVIRALRDVGLRDAFETAGRGYGYTYGHSLRPGLSFLRLDRILVSEEFAVGDAFAGGSEASPHRPVVADLYLDRRPG